MGRRRAGTSMGTQTPAVTGRRLHPDFGLEIANLDLRDTLPDYLWQSVGEALRRHALLVFRRQPLSGAELAKVARHVAESLSSAALFCVPEQPERPAAVEFDSVDRRSPLAYRHQLEPGDVLLWDTERLMKRSFG